MKRMLMTSFAVLVGCGGEMPTTFNEEAPAKEAPSAEIPADTRPTEEPPRDEPVCWISGHSYYAADGALQVEQLESQRRGAIALDGFGGVVVQRLLLTAKQGPGCKPVRLVWLPVNYEQTDETVQGGFGAYIDLDDPVGAVRINHTFDQRGQIYIPAERPKQVIVDPSGPGVRLNLVFEEPYAGNRWDSLGVQVRGTLRWEVVGASRHRRWGEREVDLARADFYFGYID